MEAVPSSLFLTGATGYAGRRLLDRLARLQGRVSCLSGRLEHPASYTAALVGCDTIVHLAAATGKRPPAEHERTNLAGTRSLIEAARKAGVRRFLHISTIAVKFRDLDHYPYARTKKLAEEAVASGGVPYTILRPAMIFGADAPVFLGLSKLAGMPVAPVFGDGRTPVQPIWVDDLVAAILAILDEDDFHGHTYELGGPDVLAIGDLLGSIRRVCHGKPPRAVHLPISLVRPAVGLLEKFLFPLTPLTLGQLMTFTEDGTAAPNPLWERQRGGMKTVDEMLRLISTDARHA